MFVISLIQTMRRKGKEKKKITISNVKNVIHKTDWWKLKIIEFRRHRWTTQSRIKMVTLKVLPSNGLPGNYVVWRRKEGRKFALRIGQKRRNMVTRFIVENTIRFTPVEASLCLLDRVRPYAAFPVIVDNIRKVGFVVGQFFILIDFDMLKSSLQESLGETNYRNEEILEAIFTKKVEDEHSITDSTAAWSLKIVIAIFALVLLFQVINFDETSSFPFVSDSWIEK